MNRFPLPSQRAIDRALLFWNRLRGNLSWHEIREVILVDGGRWVEGTGLDHEKKDLLTGSNVGLCKLQRLAPSERVQVDDIEPLISRNCPCGQVIWGTNHPEIIAEIRSMMMIPNPFNGPGGQRLQ